MNQINPELLTSLHLTEAQAAVYLATLELGEASILDISKKSGVKRSSVYNFIDELKARGLMIETRKRKRAVFSAAPPRTLVEIEEARLKDLHRLLPELETIENKSRTKPRVTFYEGVNGLKEIYADQLKFRDTYLDGFSDFEASTQVMGDEYFRDYYIQERKKRGIVNRSILRDTPAARIYSRDDNKHLRESRLIQGDGLNTEIHVHSDKVWIKSFRARIPFGIIIEDHDFAATQHFVWQQLWERLPLVTTRKP